MGYVAMLILLKINTRIFANLGVEAMGICPSNDLVVQKLSIPQLSLLTHCLNKGVVDADRISVKKFFG